MDRFYDRAHAGKILAGQLNEYAGRQDVIVLALPRGGVPVAFEIAKILSLKLDILIVRKLGVPGHEELAMGALSSGGTVVYNREVIQNLHISTADIEKVIQKEQAELNRRESRYRINQSFKNLDDMTIILVDDGIATGATVRAAIQALRLKNPASIILAVPVAAYSICDELTKFVDKVVCPLKPHHFNAVGMWYEHFGQTSDEEVTELLAASGFNKTTI